MQTVENLTGITFDYYVLTSFEGVQTAVDDIGGLTIDVPFPMYDPYSRSNFDAGVQTLNGHDTLAFARDRHSLASGDFGRSENQGRVLLAALTQLRKQYAKDPSVLFDYIGAGLRIRADRPLHAGGAATSRSRRCRSTRRTCRTWWCRERSGWWAPCPR